jgi:DNA-binding NtrC family response regulator
MTTAMIPSTLVPNHAPSCDAAALLNVLIVDDDQPAREACREATAALACRTTVTDSVEQALWLVALHEIDVVLLGLKLSDAARLQILRQIKQKRSDVELVIMATNTAARPAVEAIRAGACDYLTKPFGLEELRLSLERVARQLQSRIATQQLSEQIKSNGFGGMIGRAPEMDKVYRIVSKAAQSTHPVLILGESGTGKELIARAIHYSGPFRDKPFIPIDCGSLVPTLIESELFGYAKGAFTGAAQAKQGLLAIAEGGTVFLDEIGELALDLQAKLLRAFQEKEIRPVGGTKALPINVRILAATNRDLEQAVGKGTFRRDLYFRLNVLTVRLPALRERKQDIPLLAAHVIDRISRTSGRRSSLSDEAMQALIAYDWPGHVRELENCIERCCAMNSGPVIHTVDLPSHIRATGQECLRTPTARISQLADLERDAILAAVTQLNGDKLMAARLLGIGKTTLYRKLKQYEVLQ